MRLSIDNEVVQQVVSNTKAFETKHAKSERSKNCQYFTPYDIAEYMCTFERKVEVPPNQFKTTGRGLLYVNIAFTGVFSDIFFLQYPIW